MKSAYRRRQCECPASPSGKHCWHALEGEKAHLYPYWLAVCCWCGAFRYQEQDPEEIPENHGRYCDIL